MLRNPLTKSGPISPKAHGAWLGAGTGVAVANIIVGLIEAYGTHKALPGAAVAAINFASTPVTAFLGAWLAPLFSKVMTSSSPPTYQPFSTTPASPPGP